MARSKKRDAERQDELGMAWLDSPDPNLALRYWNKVWIKIAPHYLLPYAGTPLSVSGVPSSAQEPIKSWTVMRAAHRQASMWSPDKLSETLWDLDVGLREVAFIVDIGARSLGKTRLQSGPQVLLRRH